MPTVSPTQLTFFQALTKSPHTLTVDTGGVPGTPFYIGAVSIRQLNEKSGQLWVGINDIQLGDNWGPGYWGAVFGLR